jgi:hypothetical protein
MFHFLLRYSKLCIIPLHCPLILYSVLLPRTSSQFPSLPCSQAVMQTTAGRVMKRLGFSALQVLLAAPATYLWYLCR